MPKPRKLPSGRHQARYYVMEGDRRVSRSAGTFTSKRDAQDAIDAELVKLRSGTWVDPLRSSMTVKDWAEKWYAAREPRRKVLSFLNAQILPRWGSWQMDRVRNLDVKTWVREMTTAGLSPETVRAVYATFSTMMTDAANERVIDRSPCWQRRDGLPPIQRTKLNYLTVEQGVALVAAVPAQYKAMFHLALWTGMRWGELAALRWENVDLAVGLIRVCESVKREDGQIGRPKNGKVREVAIGAATVDVLRAHRRDFGAHDLVFTSPRGQQLSYPRFRRSVMIPAAEALELDWKMSFHTLRHTYVSTLLDAGVDALVVAEQAGHSRASFTIDRYGHAPHTKADVVRIAIAKAMQRQSDG
jgi:integrase